MAKRWMMVFTAILAVVGCSGVRVSQDYDPATDFSGLKTFGWETATQEKSGDPRIDNPLLDARIRAAVEDLLREKGFAPADRQRPSVLVRYQYVIRQRLESHGTAGGFGFGIGTYGSHGGIAIGTGSDLREVDEAALIIDLLDPASQRLLWRGSGTQRFVEYDDPEKTRQQIDILVAQIFAQYPPKEIR